MHCVVCSWQETKRMGGMDYGSVVVHRQFISSKPENIFLCPCTSWIVEMRFHSPIYGSGKKKWGIRNERRRDKTTKWGIKTRSGCWNALHFLFVRDTQGWESEMWCEERQDGDREDQGLICDSSHLCPIFFYSFRSRPLSPLYLHSWLYGCVYTRGRVCWLVSLSVSCLPHCHPFLSCLFPLFFFHSHNHSPCCIVDSRWQT